MHAAKSEIELKSSSSFINNKSQLA